MKRPLVLLFTVLLAACLWGEARAELIPTPSFSDHTVPTTQVPQVRSQAWQAIDVFLLVAALVLATWLTHVARSRNGLLLLTIASLIWFGFVRGGCVCAIGATQNVALAAFNPDYAIPLAVICFFVVPLVFTLFFGRTFCAAVCPLGAIQELVAVRSVRVPSWLDQALGLLAYIYLGLAVILAATGTTFLICRYDPFVGFFRMSGNANMMVFGGCLLLIGLFVGRPYCRYLCPYGAILRVFSRFSQWRVRIPPEACIHCRLCEDACPYDAIRPPTVPQTVEERQSGRRVFVVLVCLAPLLVLLFAGLGNALATPLSRWHPEVRLAEQLRREELGKTELTTDASEAYRSAGRPVTEAYRTALDWRSRYRSLGVWLGGWVGLVLAGKLVHLSMRRRQSDYEPDVSGCVSCGRCFWYCPVEQVRLGLIREIPENLPEKKP